MPRKKIDLTGMIFGRLRVIRLFGIKCGRSSWECICQCGKKTIAEQDALKSKKKISCGCAHIEMLKAQSKKNITHGCSKKRIYRIWYGMKMRCEYQKHKSFKNYGGRGIKVCAEWHDAATFINWAFSHGYRNDLSIDRFPNRNGNYEPFNCRWATQSMQQKNKNQGMRDQHGRFA